MRAPRQLGITRRSVLSAAASLFAAAGAGCTGGGGGGSVEGLAVAEQISVVTAEDGGGRLAKAVEDFPAGSDYFTDERHAFVFDESMESLGVVNEILCLMAQTGYDEMVNRGNYNAQIDESLCKQGSNQGSEGTETGQSSGAQGEEPEIWVVSSRRGSNASDQVVKVWVPNGNDDGQGESTIHVKAVISEAASDANPFGSFVMNFAGVLDAGGTEDDPIFTGTLRTVDASTGDSGFTFHFGRGDVTTAQAEGASAELTRLNVNMQAGGASGQAIVSHQFRENFGAGDSGLQSSLFRVAFNETNVLREEEGADSACLSRTQFNTKVWRYNLYYAGDDPDGRWSAGDRVTRNGGFGFQFSDGEGQSHYGWAGYWGVWTPEGTQLVTGDLVTRHELGSNDQTTYEVVSAPGRLIKSTRQTLTLAEIVGETFQWNELDQDLGSATMFRLALVPSGGSHAFQKTGQWNFASNQWDEISPPVDLIVADGQWLGMWSDSLGGSVNYIGGQSSVSFYATTFVNGEDGLFGGADSVTLVGYQQCLRTGITGAEAEAGDIYQPDSNDVSAPHRFTFSKDDLALFEEGSVDTVGLLTGEAPASGPYTWGMRSGPMVPEGTPLNSVSDLWSQDVFYNYETGPNSWNRYTALREPGGSFVSFDPPLQFGYAHSAENDADGDATYEGKRVFLQYNGPGDLWGIPFEGVSFGGGSGRDRWYPIFSIADGTLVGPTGTEYVVKAVELEQRLAEVDAGDCSTLTLPEEADLPLPSAADYEAPGIGDKPEVTDPPAVISGVAQG